MSSKVEYKNEFESIILTGDTTEALKALVPGTPSSLYVKFNAEFTKSASEKKITPELIEILNQMNNSKQLELHKECELKRILLEYDFPSTTEARKKEIIDGLNSKFFRYTFDHPKPDIATNISLTTAKSKYPSILTEEAINEGIKKKTTSMNYSPLTEIQQRKEIKRHQLLNSIETMPEVYSKIITDNIPMSFSLLSDAALKSFMTVFGKSGIDLTDKFPFEKFTIKQLEMINEIIDEKVISKDELLHAILQKKFNSQLELLKGNEVKQRELLIEELNYAK